ncbi:MAG TPA: LamG-like jellyroll fold domain-containing protein [Chryseosolibacter sp.]
MPTVAQLDNIGSGRAIRFDGIDDYIDLGDIYDDLTLPLTISAWVYVDPDNNVIQYPIFASQDNTPVYNGFTFVCSTLPHIGFTIGDGKGGNNPAFRRSRAGYFKTLGRWIYMTTVAKSGYDIQTYMNGHDVSGDYQGSSQYPMNSSSPGKVAKIGYLFSNSLNFWFKGIMDEVRIWNRALTTDEIRASMCHRLKANEPGLIGYWNFDETSGDQVKDLSPNGFHGIMKGNPTRVFSGAPVGDESKFFYTNDWTGKTLTKDGLTVTKVTGSPYGLHIYTINQVPSQTAGLDISTLQLPYYGVFLADDGGDNTFDFMFEESSCSVFQRNDNSEPQWDPVQVLAGIKTRGEFIRGFELADLETDLGEDITICDQSSLLLQAHPSPVGKTFLWNTGEKTPSISVTRSGTFSVKVTEGCQTAMDSIRISFLQKPVAFSLGEDEVWCRLESRVLSVDFETDNVQLSWQDGSSDTAFVVEDFGTYFLKVENACGVSVDSITFTKEEYNDLQTYNFISPDTDDDLNQYFMIDERISGSRFIVFNRWGKQVFESSRYLNDWDGGGLPSGVYFYTLEHECIEPLKGTVTIMR